MQRSIETIGTIAAALAKAQAELINPEKSQVATVRPSGSWRGRPVSRSRHCRAASTSYVRLWVSTRSPPQTTAIDHEAGLIRLTTMLAHSSGEWVVIRLAGLPDQRNRCATPDGAALTYARRYALFTLVGIAGEDDIDAPDLNAPSAPQSGPKKRRRTAVIA